MEIVFEGEGKPEEKPLTLADIEVGEEFVRGFGGTFASEPCMRVVYYKDPGPSIYYVNKSTFTLNKVDLPRAAQVERIDPAPKPEPITLGELKVGAHFRFAEKEYEEDETDLGVCRVVQSRRGNEGGWIPWIAEKDGRNAAGKPDCEVIPLHGVKLVIPKQGGAE